MIFADADLDVCVEKSIWAVFDNAGQDCCARSRTFVERPIYDEFVDRFAKRAESIAVGEPLDEATEMGPLISRASGRRHSDYIAPGSRRGRDGASPAATCPSARALPAAGRPGRRPTTRCAWRGRRSSAPSRRSSRSTTEDEAIRMANDSPYGLSGSVWTQNLGSRDPRRRRRIRRAYISVNSVVERAHRGAVRRLQAERASAARWACTPPSSIPS